MSQPAQRDLIRSTAVRRARRALPQVAEVVYAVGSFGISCTMLRNWPDPYGYWRDTDTLAYALLAAVYLPLALRRRAPLLILATTATCVFTYFTLAYYHVTAVCGLGLALYTVAALRPRRVSLRCAVLTLAVLLWGTRLAEPGIGPLSVAFVTSMTTVCWVAGDGSRRLAERGERLALLTRQLHHEKEERARQAVIQERLRMARELHDVVAHHVSVISVQTGLARYVFASDPATARAALETIAGSSQEAMAEMRRMLVVLRHGGDPGEERAVEAALGPAPGLGRLEELVQRVAAAGVDVRVTCAGTPYALPAGVDLCAYRVVQEALTNVIKHAPDARTATVQVEYGPSAVSVTVTDDGNQPVSAGRSPFAGHGLIGMRERVTIYGGTVTAGPAPRGGFEVRLTLPVTDEP
ncbi:sensor histidine kinase [Streptomyces sp. NPDC090022]|uniref:sensor histidine kinase n=1 Tax=Streptomyces sp. NPDC090022 TaxID=3365920 RepID=UPI0037F13FAA